MSKGSHRNETTHVGRQNIDLNCVKTTTNSAQSRPSTLSSQEIKRQTQEFNKAWMAKHANQTVTSFDMPHRNVGTRKDTG